MLKLFLLAAAVVLVLLVVQRLLAGTIVAPREVAQLLATGRAVLVDVREPAEWSGGVIDGAYLLPLSELRTTGGRWDAFLRELGGREVLLYCRSGNRSGRAAAALKGRGLSARNAGAFAVLAAGPLSVRRPSESEASPSR